MVTEPEPYRLSMVYRDPGREGYRTVQIVRPGEPLSPLAFPDLTVDTGELLR